MKKTSYWLLALFFLLLSCASGCAKQETLQMATIARSSSIFQSFTEGFHNNIILENRYLIILDGLKTTLIISFFSVLFGTLLGAGVCFMRMSLHKWLRRFASVYISLMRGVPVLVLLMIMYYVVFGNANVSPILVAVLAFGMNFAAYVSEMFRAAIESIDRGQTEAGIAGGFTKIQTFVYIIMPQAVRRVLSVYKGEVISLVKMTSIVGYIAVQDLTKASDIIRSRTFDAFFPLVMTAVLYFSISALLLQLLNQFEQRTDPRRQQRHVARSDRSGWWLALKISLLVLLLGAGIFFFYSPATTEKTLTITPGPITTPADLDGKRIAVITGTTGDFVIRDKYKKAQILDMLYPADAALAIKPNKADAFVYDKNTLQYIIAKNQDQFELLSERLSVVDIVIPMRLNDKSLHQKINTAIAKFNQDGTLAAPYQKWILSPTTPTVPKINLDGRNGTLKMGTCLLSEAYDAMIAALQVGNIDLAIANFYKKVEERQKACAFSIPYIRNDISAMVRGQNS